MAYAVLFPGANNILKAPPGRDDVSDLPIFRNRAMVVSCWELEPEERQQVAEMGRIFLSIMGPTMAPAFVGGADVMRSFTADFGALPKQRAADDQ